MRFWAHLARYAKTTAKAIMKARRGERSLKDSQMIQAPTIPTASADPNVAILKNHSILSDLFIVLHCHYSTVSFVPTVVKRFNRELRGSREVGS
jgi:hypothetical protein